MAEAEPSALGIFAAELKAQRTRLGWTQAELGDKMGFSGSFVSDVERSERTPRIDFARACDREMGLPGSLERLHELVQRSAYPSWFSPVIPFEASAVRIHGWELGAVPGLLQTEEYARAQIKSGRPADTGSAIDRLVSARIERQAILTGDSPPMIWYVIDEGALRHVVGSPAVMGAQLDRLIEASDTPGIVIQVLPFRSDNHAGSDGPITVYEFAKEPTVAYTECYSGGRIVEAHAEVGGLMTVLSLIRASALAPRESRELIRQIRSEL